MELDKSKSDILIPVMNIADENMPEGWLYLLHLNDSEGKKIFYNVEVVWKIPMSDEEKFRYTMEQ